MSPSGAISSTLCTIRAPHCRAAKAVREAASPPSVVPGRQSAVKNSCTVQLAASNTCTSAWACCPLRSWASTLGFPPVAPRTARATSAKPFGSAGKQCTPCRPNSWQVRSSCAVELTTTAGRSCSMICATTSVGIPGGPDLGKTTAPCPPRCQSSGRNHDGSSCATSGSPASGTVKGAARGGSVASIPGAVAGGRFTTANSQ